MPQTDFKILFENWRKMVGFSGFDHDEFVQISDCSAAEAAFAARFKTAESRLLAWTPTTAGEAACLLEVVAASGDLSAASLQALARIRGWILTQVERRGENGSLPDIACASARD